MLNLKTSLALVALLALIACGGAAPAAKTDAAAQETYSLSYTAPAGSTGAPVVRLNSSLSTATTAVFDIVGNRASEIRGVVTNLQVDLSKVTFVTPPGESALVSGGGFGGSNLHTKSKVLPDGTNLMVVALRRPGTPLSGSGVVMRFALQMNSNPVLGVVRAEVRDGSGLADSDGKIVAGTSPVFGRLEVVKS